MASGSVAAAGRADVAAPGVLLGAGVAGGEDLDGEGASVVAGGCGVAGVAGGVDCGWEGSSAGAGGGGVAGARGAALRQPAARTSARTA
jgi:hypothetical protein